MLGRSITASLAFFFTSAIESGSRSSAMSTVPDCSAIRRAEGSGIDLRMILPTLAFSPQ